IEITGYSREELLSLEIWGLIHPDDRQRAMNRWMSRKRGEALEPRFEMRILTKNGEERSVVVTGGAIKVQGQPAVLITSFDITERNRVEEALREREGIFRTLAESVSANIFISRGTKYIYANAAAVAQTGYSREELLSMDLSDLIHPDYVEQVKQRTLARQRGKPAETHYEIKILSKSGEERWWETTAAMIVFQGLPAVLVTSFDVTKRKHAEAALRESEERYRQFVELCPDAILVHSEGKLVFVNSAACNLVGASEPDQVLGRQALEFVHPDDREVVRDRIRQLTEQGDRVSLLEERFVGLDGVTRYG